MNVLSRILPLALVAACSSNGTTSAPDAGRVADGPRLADGPRAPDASADAAAAAVPVLPCTDTLGSVYEASAAGGEAPGAILRCARDARLSLPQVAAASQSLGYRGRTATSGAQVYRIAYRTTRGGTGRPGVGTALVLVPDHPRVSGPQPLVVAAHGVVGQARRCAPSRYDALAVGDMADDARSIYVPVAGDGWLVVAVDYAGFAGDWPPGFLFADDEARSILDATRAARQLLGAAALSGKVGLLGHSQGGHAVLSAQALAKSYGLEGQLVAVAAFTPLWIPATYFAAGLSEISGFTTANAAYLIGYAIQYFWTHAELLEGRAAAEALFQPRVLDGIRSFVEDACLLEAETRLPPLGMTPADLFEQTFNDDVSTCALDPRTCTSPLAQKWRDRLAADRPHVDPAGAPIWVGFGGADATITPPRARCALDRLRSDLGAQGATATLTVCGDPRGLHGQIGGINDNYPLATSRLLMEPALRYLEHHLLGAPAPTCSEDILPPGTPMPDCPQVPPND